MNDFTALFKSFQHPDALLISFINKITGMIYPYIPIWVGLMLLFVAKVRKEAPSDVVHGMIFFPTLLLDVWANYIFITSDIQGQVVIGITGVILLLASIWIYAKAKVMDIQVSAL